MKYAAIVTLTRGERTGATVQAPDRATAWRKLLEVFGGGEYVREIELCEILMDEREI